MLTNVVNLRRKPYDIYIGRPGKGKSGYFGNPFALGKNGDRAAVLKEYRSWFQKRLLTDPAFRVGVEALRGKTLGCFCKPQACHGDVIAEYLNSRPVVQPGAVDIRKRLKNWFSCKRCRLAKTRRQVVLGRGVVPSEILFIGEAPGRSEDLRGEAFVGRAGKILDAALADAAKLAGRENSPPTFYVTNTVGCIPLDEKQGPFREPLRDEILACWPRVASTARLVDPDHIVLLGNVAAEAVGDKFPEAKRLRHPAYILRRGGLASTEYRTFVRELADIFRQKPLGRLQPKDTFGDPIGKHR